MTNDALRAAIAADLKAVRPLRRPAVRALALAPLAASLLLAAPVVFDFRDLTTLGWIWSWGASILQTTIGLSLVAIALREAVPGRGWSTRVYLLLSAAVLVLLLVITRGAWSASPVPLARYWWQIGAMCAAGSAASALPAVVLSAILIARAYPVRPFVAGAIAGFGGGLLADAGWRLFCHFSEPGHVIGAHMGGVAVAATIGALLTSWLVRRAPST